LPFKAYLWAKQRQVLATLRAIFAEDAAILPELLNVSTVALEAPVRSDCRSPSTIRIHGAALFGPEIGAERATV